MDDLVRAVLITLGVLVLRRAGGDHLRDVAVQDPAPGPGRHAGALFYLALPIDVLPEALLGPLGLIDDTGLIAVVGIWVYKLAKARQKLVEGGVIKQRRPVVTDDE